MVSHARTAEPGETGGVLMGWWNGDDIVIADAIGPGPGAYHAETSFAPDHDWQLDHIADLYAASGRKLQYLGDWHTHPEGTPNPSVRDIRTLRHISRHSDARCPQPVMCILGRDADGRRAMAVHLLYSGRVRRRVVPVNPLRIYGGDR